jgi:DNA-directed RNA polymerase alpha subunit
VLDRNMHIATVGEGGKLASKCASSPAAATFRADRNNDEDLAIGYIPIDSVHSPVRKVNFTVEAARLGQMTDYDKLTIEVWTNGAISPAGRHRPGRQAAEGSHDDLHQLRRAAGSGRRAGRAQPRPDERSAQPLAWKSWS